MANRWRGRAIRPRAAPSSVVSRSDSNVKQRAKLGLDTASRSRGAMRPSFARNASPSLRRGCAERRTHHASAATCAKWKAHELVTTVAPDTSGVPRAVGFRLASCSPRQRSKPDAVVSAVLRACGCRHAKSSPDFAGPHDLGRRAKAMPTGHISAPVRTAQRRRPPQRKSLTRLRPLSAPFVQGARSPSGLAPCDLRSCPTLPRPPHPAPRTVTIAKRPSHRGGICRNIYL
jgi:hypothetical protein